MDEDDEGEGVGDGVGVVTCGFTLGKLVVTLPEMRLDPVSLETDDVPPEITGVLLTKLVSILGETM